MEPQTPSTPEQPSVAPQQDMSAPAPMPASQQPMATPTPQPAVGAPMATPASAQNPGHGMGIAGLILAFIAPLIGLILSIIAMNKSKKAGMKNGLALAGIIIASINVVVGLIIGSLMALGAAKIASVCADEGPGTHFVDGVSYTCD